MGILARPARTLNTGHPKLGRANTPMWIGRGHGAHNYVGKLEAGPAAGAWVPDTEKLASVIEISKATSSPMDEHIMGGIAILPGITSRLRLRRLVWETATTDAESPRASASA